MSIVVRHACATAHRVGDTGNYWDLRLPITILPPVQVSTDIVPSSRSGMSVGRGIGALRWLLGGFRSWYHLRLYQDVSQIVTVHTHWDLISFLLLLYVLATAKVKAARVPTCDCTLMATL